MKKINRESGMIDGDFDEKMLDALIQEALADDILVAVPEDFADRMEKKAQQINLHQYWIDEFLRHSTIIGGAILMLATVFAVFYYFQSEYLSGIIHFLTQYKWIIMMGIIFLFIIQLADSWLHRKLDSSSI